MSTIRQLLCAVALSLGTVAPLHAETISWTGSAGDGEWATAANWNLGRVPAAGDDVVIDAAAQPVTYRRDAASIHSLQCAAEFTLTTTAGLPATLSIDADAVFGSGLTVIGGTLTGAAPISVNGLFHWAGGAITSPVAETPITANDLFVMSSSIQKALGRRLVLAAGAAGSWSGLGVLSVSHQTVIEIQSGAVFELLNDVNILETPGTGNALILNSGTLRKRSGAGVSTLGVFLDNAGLFEIDSGVAAISHGYHQSAGELLQAGGNVRCESLLSLDGGVLRGVGTVEAGVTNTGATLRPGLDIGTLNIAGPYAQSTGAAVEFEFDNEGGLLKFDDIVFSDVAIIDGEVALRFLTPPPLVGTYVVATGPSIAGDARHVAMYCLDPSADAQVDFTDTEIAVSFDAETCPADLNGDGQITLQDLALFLSNFGLPSASREAGDLDGDCDVDLADLAVLLSAFGNGCP